MSKKRVLFVGETWSVIKLHTKGFDVVALGGYEDYSSYFTEPMKEFEDIEISHIPNHLVMGQFPQTPEQLKLFDVVIISDCGRNTLTMYPDMFTVPMGPDRVQLIADYVRKGGSLIMVGGYLNYQGYQGKGNYHGSAIEEVLPVDILDRDDRVERTDGVRVNVLKPDHPVLKGIPKEWPLFLGYHEIIPKKGSEVLASVDDDPFIVVGEIEKGRSMAFGSDMCPHWGEDFVKWDYYGQFWYQAIQWLTK
ncbi:MAG: cytoplasmic protein [Firmicutes bacterium]|nr:cytoplasmic protein [Bacillota bacterium]